MKNILLLIILSIILIGCGNKPAYKTREGRIKLRFYNRIQFGHPSVEKEAIKYMKKGKKKKK